MGKPNKARRFIISALSESFSSQMSASLRSTKTLFLYKLYLTLNYFKNIIIILLRHETILQVHTLALENPSDVKHPEFDTIQSEDKIVVKSESIVIIFFSLQLVIFLI